MEENFSDSFNEHADGLRDRRKQDDFDNLQHSLSGVETGQQVRHGLSKDTSGSVFGDKRKTITEQIRETLEWLLLNNPAYAEAHETAMTSLLSAEQAATSVLDKVLSAFEREQIKLDQLLKSAASLPGGRKVFRDGNGDVRSEDGSIITDDLAILIVWRGNEPTYEEYQSQMNRVEEFKQASDELRGVEVELGGIRGELSDNENPLSLERVDELKKRSQKLEERVHEIHVEAFEKMPLQTELQEASELDTDLQMETKTIPVVKIGK